MQTHILEQIIYISFPYLNRHFFPIYKDAL